MAGVGAGMLTLPSAPRSAAASETCAAAMRLERSAHDHVQNDPPFRNRAQQEGIYV